MMLVIQLLVQFAVSFLATLSFAVIFSAPKKELLFCGFTGGLGWLVYYILYEGGCNFAIASLLATLVLTFFARIFAVIRRNPVTVYLLTGIFPLVPGAGIYYTAFYLFNADQSMFARKGLETFETAAAIVFGIIFGFAIPQALFNRLSQTKER